MLCVSTLLKIGTRVHDYVFDQHSNFQLIPFYASHTRRRRAKPIRKTGPAPPHGPACSKHWFSYEVLSDTFACDLYKTEWVGELIRNITGCMRKNFERIRSTLVPRIRRRDVCGPIYWVTLRGQGKREANYFRDNLRICISYLSNLPNFSAEIP